MSFSCKEEQQNSATFIDFSIPIHVMNRAGNNLLDEDTEGHYNTDSIRIYYVINGKSTMFYKPSADFSYGYVIGNNPGIGNFSPSMQTLKLLSSQQLPTSNGTRVQ